MATHKLIRHFEYSHLPANFQEVFKPIYDLAEKMDNLLPNCDEKSIGLRKLLEAKECFIRARLEKVNAAD